ncbi:glycerate kinase [Alicyclobacillus tolerans]|uniref:Glycerate kinase n=2 Tax=Alicyclobacillus tolerans TaxID=90970 RepID=A0A1M6K6M2_9BACL|nr:MULTISPECIES: glycerate kinase [Alicyclobacillus]MDP9727297.1 glycerate kinase [Alicyclobacillus tengchongensis]QRF23049.1 glycerate kinase [Alicyclobacillus sp. TC]SHJ54483.1 glycerate kinase [Alicyclobacillus montanus]
MRVLVAPDSYKGTLSAVTAAELMAKALKRVQKTMEVDLAPMADGGEGTLEVLQKKLHAQVIRIHAMDAFGEPHSSYYLIQDHTAYIELANICGYVPLKGSEKSKLERALQANTYGLGQVILDALMRGITEIVLALGGSASTDGGYGLLAALGAQYLDDTDDRLSGKDARELERVRTISLQGVHPAVYHVNFTVLADVQNPLTGINGSATVYGPQKGLTSPEAIQKRDMELSRFASLLENSLHISPLAQEPGMGAAGGAALPLFAFGKATRVAGANYVAEKLEIPDRIMNADFVITGEGQVDASTREGKVPAYMGQLASQMNKSCAVVAGRFGEGHERLFECGVSYMVEAAPTHSEDDSPALRLQQAVIQVAQEMIRELEHSQRTKKGDLTHE